MIPALRRERLWPDHIVYIGKIKRLARIKVDGKMLKIGPLATIAELENSAVIAKKAPLIRFAAAELGGPAVRNLATIGGNLINASPAADMACALLALNANLTIRSKTGTREAPIVNFFKGPKLADIAPNEILAEISVPLDGAGVLSKFMKLGKRKSLAISVVSCAITVKPGDGGLCEKATIALGAVAPTPIRAFDAERLLAGAKITDELLELVAEKAASCTSAIDDIRGGAWYRKRMAGQLVKNGIKELFAGRNDR